MPNPLPKRAAMTSPLLSAAVDANLQVIHQVVVLLPRLGRERYLERLAVCYHASVGAHLRHIIEHYQAFLDGLADARIDYEHRARDRAIEADPKVALAALAEVAQRLGALRMTGPDRTLAIASETAPGSAAPSSLLRELEFLLSHTVHHYALIATLARLQGVEPEPTFGVAPSTLKFQQQEQRACAR